jgi:hypothetical protein
MRSIDFENGRCLAIACACPHVAIGIRFARIGAGCAGPSGRANKPRQAGQIAQNTRSSALAKPGSKRVERRGVEAMICKIPPQAICPDNPVNY